MKIRAKFQVAFMLLFIILAVSIASVIYFTLLSHFEEVEGNRLNERVRSTAKAVDNFMLTRVADFNVLSNNPLFSSSSSEVSSQYLTRVVNQYPYYNSLFFANKEGVILSSSNQKFIGENILHFDPDIQNGINKTLSGGHEDVYISELSIATQKEITRNKPLDLKFFSDVIDLEGNVVGVLVGFMNMKPLNDLILYTDKISVGNKHTYLVNNKGVVFVSGNKEVEIFKQHPDLLINELQKKIEGGERGFYFNQNAKGLKLLSGYAALSKYGTDGVDNWFLLRTVPFNEIMKPFFKTVYIAVFIFLLIISLIVIFLFYSYTKRVKNSLSLAEKREFSLKEASKVAKIGFQEYDIASNTFTWSDYVYHIFGFDPKDGMPSLEKIISVFDDVSKEKIGKAAKAIDFEGIPCDIELKLINQRNEELWVRYVAHAVYNDQNKIVGRRGVLQNITEAKNAQLELELSKQKVQASLELLEKSEKSKNEASRTAKIGFIEDDIATETYTWSEYVFQIFGFDPNFPTPSAKEIEALFEEEDLKILKKSTFELDKFGISYDVELKLKNLRNEDIWIRLVVQPVYNKRNQIVKRQGVLQDITASKNAQLELELSKQKIQTSLELVEQSEQSKVEVSKVAKIGYWEEDFTTNKVVWSDYVYQIFEVNPTDGIPENSFIVEKFDKESQEKLIKVRQDITYKGTPYDVQLKFVNLKKEDVWVRFVAQPVFNSQNEIIGRKGVLQDITVSKKVQLELELSKQKIQTSLELLEESERFKDDASKIAKIGYWSYDSITDTVKWSDYVFQIFGLKPQKNAPLLSETAKFFDEESQKKIAQVTLDVSTKGIPYDIELKFINTKNEEIWIRTKCQPIYNEHNEIIGRGGITQDITASKKAQLELELSKQKIQASLELLENSEYSKNEGSKIAKIGYWEHNLETNNVVWSDYLYQVFESNPKDGVPLQNELMEKFDKESQVKLTQATLDIISKGINYDIELKFKNLKNEDVWLRIVAQPIYNQQQKIVGKRGVMQNITAAKKIQLELESSKEKIETSLHLLEISEFAKNETSKIAKIGHWEYSIITDTFIWSDYIYEVYGLELTDKIPSRNEIIQFYDEPSQQILEQATLELDSKGIPYDVEMKLINRNNEEIWVRQVVQLVYSQQNEVIGRRGVLHNITAFKNAQQELEVSKQKIEEALVLAKKRKQSMDEASKMASIGFMDYNYETKSNTWSEHVYTIFGLDSSKPVPPQTEIAPFFDEESLEKHAKAVLDLSTNGIPYDIELKMNNFKNKEVWIRLATQGVYNQQNQIIGRRGLVQDITESKKAQFALELSNQKIQSTLEVVQENEYSLKEAGRMAKIGYWSYSKESDRIFWSKAVHEIYGNDPENGVPDFNVIKSCYDEESLERFADAIENLNHKAVSFDIELHLTNLKGQKRWIRNIGEAVFNDKNEIIGRRGVSQDITIQKQIEEKNLRISEEFKELFESVTTSIWNEDLSLIYKEIAKLRKQHIPNFKIYLENNPELIVSLIKKVKVNNVNKATLKLFKAKNLKEFRTNIDLTFGEGADKVFGKLLEAIWNNNKTFTSEVNYKKLNGDEFTALLSVPIPQTEAKQKSVPISIQSIQSIKDAEYAKRELLLRLNNSEKLAHIGSWLFDITTQEIKWSEEMFYIWGFDRKKSVPELEKIIGRIHKDDLNLFNSTSSAAVDNGTPYDIEFRICLPKDEIKWIRAICQPILGDDGNVVSLTGSNQNITAQKQALFKIEKAEEMYRLLTDNSNDLICLHEPDGTFKYVSPSIKHLLGYEVSDYLGKEVFSIVHPQDVSALQDAMKNKVFNNNFNEAYTLRIRHKKGYYIWFEFLSSPVYKDNKISYYVTSAREITQWILAKQEIQEYQTSLQKLTTEITLIEEKQKKEIASNIHDHLSQSLVISKMRINAMKKNARFKEIDQDLLFIETHISEALENSRKITYELSPPVLYHLGIIEALNWLLDDVETTHKISCSFYSNVNRVKLGDVKSILLYRSIQEVIKNTIKYAKATLITLDINKKEKGIHILISDDGVGFDTAVLKNLHTRSGSGFGLFTVQERIQNIKGKFKIESEINTGTTVKIFIPLT